MTLKKQPPKPERITARLTVEELAMLNELVNATGLAASTLIRSLIRKEHAGSKHRAITGYGKTDVELADLITTKGRRPEPN